VFYHYIPVRDVITNYTMYINKLRDLLRQYFNDTINSSDYNELLDYLKNADQDIVEQAIDEEILNLDSGADFSQKQSAKVLVRIKTDPRFTITGDQTDIGQHNIVRFYQRTWLRAAAAILIFCTAGLLFIRQLNFQRNAVKLVKRTSVQIVPGGQNAKLTMANGKVIVLANAANGVLANIGGNKIIKRNAGQIVYDDKAASQADVQTGYNTLTTPRGGEYQVVLPDGSKVWLNAASSITYPTQFTGNERRVKLTGEAYFEVAKNKAKPFYVTMNDVQVRVLGTHFNISAYGDDEAVTATLLEGSVQISKNKSLSLLKPGQQAVINYNTDDISVSDANIEDAMAWKNGYFIFNDDNITGIMKKVSRWYNVDVYYSADLNDQKFGGAYYRNKNIGELLQYLEMIGKIHFKIEGRRITVMK